MIKQRKDSDHTQFEAGGRQDLADIEKGELAILSAYMPAGLSDAETKLRSMKQWRKLAQPAHKIWVN